ncbi:gamma-glutamylcyclotransferase family protein [Alicyclobacillus sp. SO9]|uniref:gamma-glutamylcyclotransferase family protein n=1 Tax=Alicyclobacillus sp. SO9 TaxID=2665646 RepID=UPI0018E8650D|nr:gamma-glutamylcyclotransferase family protein [Alicyclobacillus sp. SO9]QQE79974.1 gamma-glutamylcyclotransferase [Alicyclobacillus sp. SO9]
MADDLVLYFAFGSCMSPQDFQRTVPQFEILGPAVLQDYKVAFTHYAAGRAGGVADIVSAPGRQVEGVLYQFPVVYLSRLDEREGVPENTYERITVDVSLNHQTKSAVTYTIVTKSETELAPSNLYRDIILDGAALLSENYRRQLREHMEQLQSE